MFRPGEELPNRKLMTARQLTLFNQVSEIQITCRNAIKFAYRPKITCSDDAYLVFQTN